MGIRLWVKEQVAKLRRKHDDDGDESGDNNAKHRQLQTVDGGATRQTRGCSVLFARAKKHHEDRSAARKKTRSRSHPAHASQSRSEDGDARKLCVACQKTFQVNASKYLDYCSTECKTKAFMEKGQPAEAPQRASEWI